MNCILNRRLSRSLSLAALLLAAPFAHATDIVKHVVRTNIAGIDVILYPTSLKDVVTVVGSLPAGDALAVSSSANGNPAADNVALATLTAVMLDKGTTTKDKFAIANALDHVGAQLSLGADSQTLNIQARSLKADLPLVLNILADELRRPAFTAEEFAKVKIELSGNLKQRAESTEYRADEAFSRAIFPAGHPNRGTSLEDWHSAIDHATLDQVKQFHRRIYGPSHMVLVLVGDLDIPKIQAELKKDFAGWTGGVTYAQSPKAAVAAAPVELKVSMPGKTSVTVLAGQSTGLRYHDSDSLPLRMGVAILGRGFTSRLMGTVRDKEGLTYHITAAVADDTFDDGDWNINASFAPTLLAKGLASTQRELQKWWQDGVTAEELKARKTDLIGSFQVSLATSGGIAATMLRTVQRGLPLSWIDEYPQSVDAITLAQVNGAIKRYVDPQKLIIIKAGSVDAQAGPHS
jgi:zinc protease